MLEDTCATLHASDISTIARMYPPISKTSESARIFSLNDAFPPLWEVSERESESESESESENESEIQRDTEREEGERREIGRAHV